MINRKNILLAATLLLTSVSFASSGIVLLDSETKVSKGASGGIIHYPSHNIIPYSESTKEPSKIDNLKVEVGQFHGKAGENVQISDANYIQFSNATDKDEKYTITYKLTCNNAEIDQVEHILVLAHATDNWDAKLYLTNVYDKPDTYQIIGYLNVDGIDSKGTNHVGGLFID